MLSLLTMRSKANSVSGGFSNLTALAYGERGVEPPHYPIPDLSFLPGEKADSLQATKIPWRLNELGHLVIEFSAELVRSFQPPTYNVTGLKSVKPQKTLFQFSLEDAVEDLKVTITAEERRDALFRKFEP